MTTTSATARAVGSWLAAALATVALAAALGWLPTRRLGGEAALVGLAAGCAVALAGAALGAAPVLVAVARGGGRSHVVAGWAMALRSGATLVGALVGALGGAVPRTAFLAWVAIGYGALLVVETKWMLRWLAAGGRQ